MISLWVITTIFSFLASATYSAPRSWSPNVQKLITTLSFTGNILFTGASPAWIWFAPYQLTLLSNGNVGIGISNPAYKLHINGNAMANNYYLLSDKNFKTDIIPLDWALEKITQLNGYSFTWKDTGKKDIGLIAQEVEKIFPDLVNTDTDGVKAVEYMNIIAPLVESVKSLYQENITLKAWYAKLQDQMNDLQKQLTALKK